MQRLAPLALLAALAAAKAGPDMALSLKPVQPMFAVDIVRQQSSPPRFDLDLVAAMPDPGWSLAVDRVSEPDASGRRVVEITASRAEGLFPQVITDRSVKVGLGPLPTGVHLIDLHLRRGGGAYERVQAIVLRGDGA